MSLKINLRISGWVLAPVILLVPGLSAPQKGVELQQIGFDICRKKFGWDFWRKPPSSQFGLGWTKAGLPEDKEFMALEHRVEKLLAADQKNFSAYVFKFQSEALDNPEDASLMFKWGISEVLMATVDAVEGKSHWQIDLNFRKLPQLQWLLAAIKSEHGYRFLRLRYLIEEGLLGRPDLNDFGRKLLAKDPKDAIVKRMLAMELGSSAQKQDLDEAIHLVNELISEDANKLVYVGTKVYIVETRWMRLGHQRADAEATISLCKKYIAMAPPNCPNNEAMRRRIAYLQQELAKT